MERGATHRDDPSCLELQKALSDLQKAQNRYDEAQARRATEEVERL